MRSIIIILIVRLLCVSARHKAMVGRGSGAFAGWCGAEQMDLHGAERGA